MLAKKVIDGKTTEMLVHSLGVCIDDKLPGQQVMPGLSELFHVVLVHASNLSSHNDYVG